MRIVLRIVSAAVALLVLAGAALYAASERGEVVILHSRGEDGEPRATHLWVVDDAGHAWLRSGGRERGWLRGVVANPDVDLERHGESRAYRAVIVEDPAVAARVDALMREKYGRTDAVILWLERTTETVPVRLDPR